MTKTTTKSTTMNIRLDTETRQRLQSFADELGIPASSLVTANIRQMLRTGEANFSTSLEPTPYLEKILHEVKEDLRTGHNISEPYDSAEAMIAALED